MAWWKSYSLLDPTRQRDRSRASKKVEEALQPVNSLLRPFRQQLPPALQFLLDVSLSTIIILSALSTLLVTVFYLISASSPTEDVLHHVDPLIGTGRGGHVFAGATLPFGMAKAVADVLGEHMGGFASDHTGITGFSHMHDSGTGGSPSMGNFPIFVHRNCPDDDATKCQFARFSRATKYVNESVRAEPGWFEIELVNGVRAEMTVSEHAALYRFTMLPVKATDGSEVKAENPKPLILVDAIDLPLSQGKRGVSIDPETGRMVANGTFNPSFGMGNYRAYFCADFKGAELRDVGVYGPEGITPTETKIWSENPGNNAPSRGTYARFKNVADGDTLVARVGISFLSIEKACHNAESEIPDWDFGRLRRNATKQWQDKLNPIWIDHTGVDESLVKSFWSGIYRTFISPQDYTGENQLWESSEPYYDSWYCIWDTFRSVHPFLTIVDPIAQSRMVRSLIDIWRHDGYLPECRMSFCKGYTQGGSNADVVLVDAFLKKLPDINWADAYEAIKKDAEEQPETWDREGRGGLKSWKSIGYIPWQDVEETGNGLRTRTISRTVEYAYDDFCIAQMARATGRPADYATYANRSANWRNLWDGGAAESLGFAGFLQPRRADGVFGAQAATLCSALNSPDACYLDGAGHETYEGSPWLYTFYVPHDMAALVATLGGRARFLARLDTLHDSGVLYMGDEQAFLMSFLYHYAGRPGLSARRSHAYIPSLFNATLAGIPGNDDSGAMGTFVFFNMIGLFPNAGQSVYFITPPYFREVRLRNPQTEKVAIIRNIGFDPSYERIYVQEAWLDGKRYYKNWVDHGFFAHGGTLELVLGEKESDWGTRDKDLPPSLSTGLHLGL